MPHDLPLAAHGEPGADLTVEQDHGALIRRTTLPGGVRVLSEHIPGMRSATVGAWVGVGSRDELDEHAGSTHFLEHLLFKGTARRSALDIAEAFDRVGGESNAMTAKEFTCYYARTLDDDLPLSVDVILDMVTSARIDERDFETERGVILEELAMNDDDPADVAHELFATAVFGSHRLGRPIGGTPPIIEAVHHEAVMEHYRTHYVPEGLVITAAGGVDHDQFVAVVTAALSAGGWDLSAATTPLARRAADATVLGAGAPMSTVRRPLEQSHVIVGCEGFKASHDQRATHGVLHAILGGGMSSRLFQEIREKRGLTYSVYSFGSAHAETGLFGMYGACNPKNTQQVLDLMEGELERLAQGVTPEELDRAKGQIAGSTALRLEDSYSRMSRLGRAEVILGELWSMQESLDRVRAVTARDVTEMAATLAGRTRSTVVVGPAA